MTGYLHVTHDAAGEAAAVARYRALRELDAARAAKPESTPAPQPAPATAPREPKRPPRVTRPAQRPAPPPPKPRRVEATPEQPAGGLWLSLEEVIALDALLATHPDLMDPEADR